MDGAPVGTGGRHSPVERNRWGHGARLLSLASSSQAIPEPRPSGAARGLPTPRIARSSPGGRARAFEPRLWAGFRTLHRKRRSTGRRVCRDTAGAGRAAPSWRRAHGARASPGHTTTGVPRALGPGPRARPLPGPQSQRALRAKATRTVDAILTRNGPPGPNGYPIRVSSTADGRHDHDRLIPVDHLG